MLTNEDMQAHHAAQLAIQQEAEAARREHEFEMEKRRAKLELVRLAKETLVENARNKPVGEGDVGAQDITKFAEELASYIDA